MANLSSEDETDTLPERPARIQPYQFEPVRQNFERVPGHRVSFEANPMRYSMGFAKSHSLATQMGVMRHSKKVSSFELYKFNPLLPHCRSCIAIPAVICELLQFAATQKAHIVNFFVDHTHTQFTEESKLATALTPQTDITSEKVT